MSDLRAMYSIRTGSLIDGFVPFEGVQRSTGFALRIVAFPLCLPLISPQRSHFDTASIFIIYQVFGVHYI